VKEEVLRYAWGDSTLGGFMVATSDRGLVAIEFGRPDGNLPSALRDRFTDADLVEDPVGLATLVIRMRGWRNAAVGVDHRVGFSPPMRTTAVG